MRRSEVELGPAELAPRSLKADYPGLITLPFHVQFTTGITDGALAAVARHVAGINELETGLFTDVIGVLQGGDRGGGQVL